MATKWVLLGVLFVFTLNNTAHAQSKNLVTVLPAKSHKTKHGRPLFKYPKEGNLVYIVTYTQDDLLKLKKDRMIKSLE